MKRHSSHQHPTNREKEEHAGIEIERHHVPAEGQHQSRRAAQARRRNGRKEVNDLVRGARHHVFLDERLDAVRDELAEAGEPDVRERNTDAIRAASILDAPGEPLRSMTVVSAKRPGTSSAPARSKEDGGQRLPGVPGDGRPASA